MADKDNLNHTIDKLVKQLQNQEADKREPESTEVLRELNRDVKDGEGFSTIDANTDLTHNQIIALTKLEGLSKNKFFIGELITDDSVEIITRTFQRKRISNKRLGRKEAIELFRQLESKKEARGFWEKWFSPKE